MYAYDKTCGLKVMSRQKSCHENMKKGNNAGIEVYFTVITEICEITVSSVYSISLLCVSVMKLCI